jgi:hypothetical protein
MSIIYIKIANFINFNQIFCIKKQSTPADNEREISNLLIPNPNIQ